MEVHRCRFVPYPPSAINALAFSHPSSSEHGKAIPSTLRLAIGRANGDVEIWNPLRGQWFQETTLRGGKDRSIEGLTWTQDPDEQDAEGHWRPGKLRLFSVGYSTHVTEWDLALGRPLRHSDGNYGEIWCLAAQPRFPAKDDRQTPKVKSSESQSRPLLQDLVVGCADGAVVLLSTEDGDLKFKRLLSPPAAKKARVLSVVFRSRTVVVTGCADSAIRILDARNGQLIRLMSLGAGPVGGPRETLVWSVKCLPNGDIVSGDSTGEVRFWDGRTYSLLQRLKSHRADILDVEVSADGQTVISGGMDRRTTVYRRTGGDGKNTRVTWATVNHSRLHSHDVKTMAVFDSTSMSVVVSGGLDTTPIIIPLRQYGMENHRTIPSVPQPPQVQSASRKKLLMSWWNREVWIWRFHNSSTVMRSDDRGTGGENNPTPKLVARIAIKGEENISSACLSAYGNLLAVSTSSEVKLFQLKRSKSTHGKPLRVKKVKIPGWASRLAGRLVLFSPDTRWLCMIDQESTVHIARLTQDDGSTEAFTVLPQFITLRRLERKSNDHDKTVLNGNLGSYERTITRAAFSADSRILVVGDLSGHLDSWVLAGYEDLNHNRFDSAMTQGTQDSDSSSSSEEDTPRSRSKRDQVVIFGQYWTRNPSASLIPTLPSAALILSFRPPSDSRSLALTNSTEHTHPTRHNPHPLSHDIPVVEDRLLVLTAQHQIYAFSILKGSLTPWSRRNPTSSFPYEFKDIRDRAMGCFWDVNAHQERVWIYGSSWLFKFDLSKDFPEEDKTNKRKRKRSKEDEEGRGVPTSGAGGRIPKSGLAVSFGRKMRKFIGPDHAESALVELDASYASDGQLAEEASEGLELELAGSRRGLTDTAGQLHRSGEHGNGEISEVNSSEVVEMGKKGRSSMFWHTRRYQPILGAVPISETDTGDASTGSTIKVAIIERPVWDLDLPPRFHGDQEWKN
ncbi:MAG: U3 small nucleolar RNA-associated protein [Peltula sp. TS41687]|nr:MAG: U3 small nucleolar RNA-associated protein [Peltula sp. TS41687]